MLSFESDYIQGAHEKILQRLVETNMEPMSGYGSDPYCESAKEKIRKACDCEDAEIFFLVGGTQANMVVISSMLKPYEGVVAAQTGHVSVHEAGAIEHSGHKVLTIPGHEGKIDAEELAAYLKGYWEDVNYEHMVFPGMVYVTHPTEYGTLYTKAQLSAIAEVCREYEIPLFLDGARLGYGLMSRETDVTLPMIARLCDVFYIGGTKVGALCGEAVVFPKKNMPPHFMTMAKQKGALLAKGRLLGIQFDTLFTDDLYFQISGHAIGMAEKIKEIFREKGKRFFLDSPTNQQFIILENAEMAQLQKQVRFDIWEKYDEGHTVVRFATSWATSEEDVEALRALIP
ncbi:MAG: low specificity L-threonine aldolase [Bacteroidales bacterium]|nr:low specificity L-threonine aldolase [Bacteroidales bacterium]MCM1415794.1 low specificity L-threonine aldolase [bacterium]MCM1422712.1 low specificity L-threonine aldolase [bacterium]